VINSKWNCEAVRLRQPGEILCMDIKRLMTQGYPDVGAKASEVIAVDHFIDSLGDADLALKIRERTPATLDEALRAGQRQEVCNKDAVRLGGFDRHHAIAAELPELSATAQ